MATTAPAPTQPRDASKHADREASLRNIAQTEQSEQTPSTPSTPEPAKPATPAKSADKPKDKSRSKPRDKSAPKPPSKAAQARAQREANVAKATKSAKAAPSKPEQSDDERLRDVLKRAQMSQKSELSDDARKRALDAPANLRGGALRARIQGKSSNGSKSNGETRERFAQHGDIAAAATTMLRVNAPKRGACSTRAVEFTLKHVGRKDVGKTFLPGVAKVPATLKALATGKSSVRDLPEPSQKAIKDAVAKIAAASTIVRYDARTFAAILVARDA